MILASIQSTNESNELMEALIYKSLVEHKYKSFAINIIIF